MHCKVTELLQNSLHIYIYEDNLFTFDITTLKIAEATALDGPSSKTALDVILIITSKAVLN
jgi:hypothetical protein